jgi:hypothetical protein
MKIAGRAWRNPREFGHLLFDIENDPRQQTPLADAAVERRMLELLVAGMRENDAPPEQFERLGVA